MRAAFHEQLDSLTETLSQMCELAGAAMERAAQALLQADLLSAERVITDHDHLARMQTKAEEAGLHPAGLAGPRGRGSADGRCDDAKPRQRRTDGRAGCACRQARPNADIPTTPLPEEVNAYFAEMGEVAVDLGNSAKDVVLSRDPAQAAQISRDDDAMDELHRHLFTVLMDRDWKHGVTAAVDVTLLGRFYERFADHAVEIGRRVIFEATGNHPRCNSLSQLHVVHPGHSRSAVSEMNIYTSRVCRRRWAGY